MARLMKQARVAEVSEDIVPSEDTVECLLYTVYSPVSAEGLRLLRIQSLLRDETNEVTKAAVGYNTLEATKYCQATEVTEVAKAMVGLQRSGGLVATEVTKAVVKCQLSGGFVATEVPKATVALSLPRRAKTTVVGQISQGINSANVNKVPESAAVSKASAGSSLLWRDRVCPGEAYEDTDGCHFPGHFVDSEAVVATKVLCLLRRAKTSEGGQRS